MTTVSTTVDLPTPVAAVQRRRSGASPPWPPSPGAGSRSAPARPGSC